MIWLYIYLGISALTLILFWFTVIEAAHEFKRRYPNITVPKKSVMEWVGTIFKATLLCLMPIYNILYCLALLFKGKDIKEKAVLKTYVNALMKKPENFWKF